MVLYTCPRCEYMGNHRTHMRNHFKRKNVCPSINEDINVEECIKLLNDGKLQKHYPKKEIYKIEHKCVYCSKKFDRKSRLENHKEKCKYNNEKEKIDELKKQLDKLKKAIVQKPVIPPPKKPTSHHIYIIHEREFVNSEQPIYKIGKTTQSVKRLGGYSKGSRLKLLLEVEDCHKCEKLLIQKFDELFINKPEIGREYYYGDINEMVSEFVQTVN